jgi:hypothetical protein
MLASRSTTTPQEKFALLNCRRLPGRLNISETAVLLGIQEHDIPVLVGARLILPLGKPASNAPKYFSAVEVVAKGENSEWLAQATKAIAKHWLHKNQRRKVCVH